MKAELVLGVIVKLVVQPLHSVAARSINADVIVKPRWTDVGRAASRHGSFTQFDGIRFDPYTRCASYQTPLDLQTGRAVFVSAMSNLK